MNIFKKTLLTAMLSVMAGQAMAANDKVEIKVTGQIVPAACNLILNGGGTVDFGTIAKKDLAEGEFTLRDPVERELSIQCDDKASAKIALTVVDSHPDSVETLTGQTWKSGTAANGQELGLGKSGDKNIGAWAMWLKDAQSDIKDLNFISTDVKPTEATKWNKSTNGTGWLAKHEGYTSWAEAGKADPVAVNTLNAKLVVQVGINKSSELDFAKPITLDGHATIQMFYL